MSSSLTFLCGDRPPVLHKTLLILSTQNHLLTPVYTCRGLHDTKKPACTGTCKALGRDLISPAHHPPATGQQLMIPITFLKVAKESKSFKFSSQEEMCN